MLDIYKLGEDVLSEQTTKVTEFDSALKMLVDAMFASSILKYSKQVQILYTMKRDAFQFLVSTMM